MREARSAIAAIMLLVPTAAQAGPGKGDKKATVYEQAAQTSVFSFDYGPPASPALTLMGLSPDKISLSTTLKPFVLSLPSLFDGSGNQVAGIDLAPLSLFRRPANQTFGIYQRNLL